MLITIILKIEKLIITNTRIKSNNLLEKFITPMEELPATEPYKRILFVKDTILAV